MRLLVTCCAHMFNQFCLREHASFYFLIFVLVISLGQF
jgi:hypothetical protein